MELADGKIHLRSLRYSDCKHLAVLANNKRIWNNLRDMFPHPYCVEDAEKFIDSVKQQDPRTTFAIEYDYRFVGVIGIIMQQDVYRKSGEIGYWIGEPFWNKGISTCALKLATEYAFASLGVEKLFAGVFAGNEGSRRVLEKCGYHLEGVLRKAVYKNNRFLDEGRFGKLRND